MILCHIFTYFSDCTHVLAVHLSKTKTLQMVMGVSVKQRERQWEVRIQMAEQLLYV